MGCLPSFFSNTLMGFYWEDVLIGCPKITERMAVLVFIGDSLPQTKACCFAAVANGKCYDLACPSAHRCPQPLWASFFQHKTPHLILIKNVILGCWQSRRCYRGQFLDMRAVKYGKKISRNTV